MRFLTVFNNFLLYSCIINFQILMLNEIFCALSVTNDNAKGVVLD